MSLKSDSITYIVIQTNSSHYFYFLSKLSIMFKKLKSVWSMNDVGQHSRGKIKAENMNLLVQRLVDEVNSPMNHVILNKCRDYGVLYTALLQDSDTESLSNATIFLFFQDLCILERHKYNLYLP